MENKIKVYEFVGVPGVGKTYLANKLSNKYNVYFQNNISNLKDICFLFKGNYLLLKNNKGLFFWLWLFFIRFCLPRGHRLNFFNKQKTIIYLLYYIEKPTLIILDQFILQYISTSALQNKKSVICKNLFRYYLDLFDVKLIYVRCNNYYKLLHRLKKREKYWDKIILKSRSPFLMLKEIENFYEYYIKQFNLTHISACEEDDSKKNRGFL
jgi:hypothetical protein